MIGYVMLGTNDLEKAKAFYDPLFQVIGAQRVFEVETSVAWGTSMQEPALAVTKPYDGHAASVGNGVMIALEMKDKDQVVQLYNKAIELGGTDEGKPGPRGDGFYGAYFRDLDGNKLSAFVMEEP